ncbi:MAG: DUF3830 family protein [Nitrospinota bacterium]
MARRIMLSFSRGGRLTAELLEKKAPITCDLIASQLPLKGATFHARWTGRECFLPVTLGKKPDRENAQFVISRGEMMYWREFERDYGPHEMVGTEVVAFFYGPEYLRSEWRGYERGNVFAQIPQSEWELMEEIGTRIWRQGSELMEVSLIRPSGAPVGSKEERKKGAKKVPPWRQ